MAKPPCTFCEQNEGLYMGTNLDDGDTQVACASCLVPFALGMAAAVTQGMESHEATQYLDTFAAIAANLGVTPPAPAAKRKRSRAVPVTPQPPLDGSESDTDGRVTLDPPCATCGSQTATGDAVKLSCDGCGAVIATADEATAT
jgi:hypothetical protein